jgi:hypothetical protein
MSQRSVRKLTIFIAVLIACCVGLSIFIRMLQRQKVLNITGTVLVADTDVRKQRPLEGVEVSADEGESTAITDASGLFRLKLPPSSLLKLNGGPRNQSVSLHLTHQDYLPLETTIEAGGELEVLRMKPMATPEDAIGPEIPVSDVRLRYTESAPTSADTGSALQPFEVVNKGNIPCEGRPPCSPDGKWKAAIGGTSLDAGEGHEFREARVSCVAGPCPFTKIEHDGFSQGGRIINVTVRDWSDTVNFVLEAEVSQTSMTDSIRLSYPLIFSRGMNFSLPPSGEGPSIEATVGGFEAVYPIEPALKTSWATCTVQVARDKTKSYRCDLKPGYRFQ